MVRVSLPNSRLKAAIDSPIHMGEVTCEDRPGRPGRVRVRVRVSKRTLDQRERYRAI